MFAVTVEWLRMCGRGSSCLSRSEAKKVQQWAPGPAPPTRLVTVRGSILPNRDRVIHPASMSQPSNLDADPASPSMRGTKTPRSHWTTRRWIPTFQKCCKQRQQSQYSLPGCSRGTDEGETKGLSMLSQRASKPARTWRRHASLVVLTAPPLQNTPLQFRPASRRWQGSPNWDGRATPVTSPGAPRPRFYPKTARNRAKRAPQS